MGHPVVGVGAKDAAMQLCWSDYERVCRLLDIGTQTGEFAPQSCESVGLMAADMPDATQM